MKIKSSIVGIMYGIAVFLSGISLSIIFLNDNKKLSTEYTEKEACATSDSEFESAPTGNDGVGGDPVSYETFLEGYYSNLNYNYGYNAMGSCGYVSLAMVLSYFDNYINDSIVPDALESPSVGKEKNMNLRKNSPGINRYNYKVLEIGNGVDVKMRNEDYYYNFVQPYKHCSLHANLIALGAEHFKYYDFDSESPCAAGMSDIVSVADKYLYLTLGYKRDIDYYYRVCDKGGNETIKEFVKSEIDRGVPVMMTVEFRHPDGTVDSHMCVAYAYSSVNDFIICHMGWEKEKARVLLETTGFDTYINAFSLTIDKEHTHTDNYWVYPNGNSSAEPEKYCYCDHRIITYKQTPHTYTQSYAGNDADTHLAYCSCGESISEYHNFGYSIKKTLSSTTHNGICVCGAVKEINHIWGTCTKPPSFGVGTYVECRRCHYIKRLGDDDLIRIPLVKKDEEEK